MVQVRNRTSITVNDSVREHELIAWARTCGRCGIRSKGYHTERGNKHYFCASCRAGDPLYIAHVTGKAPLKLEDTIA